MLSCFYTSARNPNKLGNKKGKIIPCPRREAGRCTAGIKNKNFSAIRWLNETIYTVHISPICDKSVATQNLTFLSYWCRKKIADALLTGIVS